jgi:hypothetical protein
MHVCLRVSVAHYAVLLPYSSAHCENTDDPNRYEAWASNVGARREPYWYKLARDRHLGLRKLGPDSAGSWIARYRDEAGSRHYQALGECSDACDFDAAKVAAESWFKDLDRGVADRHEDGELATVGSGRAAAAASDGQAGSH